MKLNFGMKRVAAALAGLAAVTLATTGLAAQSDAHEHEHGIAQVHHLKLNAGKKWSTDASLRKGMGEIRALVAAQHDAIHRNKMQAADYAALGAKIEGQVAYIVQNCKLEPEADANLHVILEDFVAGADAMQGKDHHLSPKAGAGRVIEGLSNYGKYFDHPDWRPLD